MYKDTAPYYDLIHSYKDYPTEVEKIVEIIRREHPEATSVLDIGCGTGEHVRLLSRNFTVEGIDIESRFVVLAQKKVPSGHFHVGDMRTFTLSRHFDVILCLFSSIGYLTEPKQVVAALRRFAEHLSPSGLIIIEPWFTPDAWQYKQPWLAPAVDSPEVKVCGLTISLGQGRISEIEFHYLIGESSGVRYLHEYHELALYTVDEMRSFFAEAGLLAVYDPVGITNRGLYIARQTVEH
ncbi:MAG TPA: class I SAM-dependent methyltransferase [Longimicrobiaceae bacterium]|nr:class I SAM-dependent methyltransferase [Longimicrobiaceae bacterium]